MLPDCGCLDHPARMDDLVLALINFCSAAFSILTALIQDGTYRLIWVMIALAQIMTGLVWLP